MPAVIGTAGHVDHGKTSLVKALTGLEGDRLPDERRRGITLELGFTHLRLDDGTEAGVVDVPGHERFVQAMAAGAQGFDAAMLVVAVDEGVRPQTREHLDVLRWLGVPTGVVVRTKAELPAHPGLEAQLDALLAGTFLEHAPRLDVSARTGQGLDALRAALAACLRTAPPRRRDGPRFIPIDRAFTVKGHGTVVTGTVLSGAVAVGDLVTLAPRGLHSQVRALHVFGRSVPRAEAGSRVALNLRDLEVAQVSRGLVVTAPDDAQAATRLEVEVELGAHAGRAWPRRSRLSLCLGTGHVDCELRLLGERPLEPGGRALGVLRARAPVAVCHGQRFVLRGSRALEGAGASTLGGRVLAWSPPRGASTEAALHTLATGAAAARAAVLLQRAGLPGLSPAALAAQLGEPPPPLEGAVTLDDGAHADADALSRLERKVLAAIEAAPAALATLESSLASRAPAALRAVLARLQSQGVVVLERERVRRLGTTPAPRAPEAARLLVRLEAAGLAPPSPDDLARFERLPLAQAQRHLAALVAQDAAASAGGLFFARTAVDALRARVIAHLQQKGVLTTQELKALSGVSRKFAIPLGELFDREKLTVRAGEQRTLLGSGPPP